MIGLQIDNENNARGSYVTELAFAVLLFILFFLAIADFARYFAVQAILTRASQAAVNLAAKLQDTDIDPQTSKTASYLLFNAARNKIIKRANDIALGSGMIASSSSHGMQQLRQYKMLRNSNSPKPPEDITSDVAFIRPGEKWQVDVNGSAVSISHPTKGTISSGESFKEVLRQHPFIVEMRARVRFVLPLIGEIPAIGRASAYKELITFGAYPIPTTTTTIATTTITTTTTTLEGQTTTTIVTTTTTTSVTTSSTTTTTMLILEME